MPVQRASLGSRRIADQVIGQLKRSSGGLLGALQQTTGVLLAVALAIFGIPAFIYGFFRLISASFLWLPVVLVLWLAGVVLLLVRATNPHVAPSPYREAMIRLADLSYCFECDMIFETSSGQVVPLEQLHETLYRRAARR